MSTIRRWWCERVRRGHDWGFWTIHPAAREEVETRVCELRVCERCGCREVRSTPAYTLEMLVAAIDKVRADYRGY
jgi:hypothetical protein